MSKVVCSVCGSDDVQAQVWVKLNENCETTTDFFDEMIREPAHCWCCNCGENQKLIIVEREPPKENHPEIFRCEECGSANVLLQAWVDPNNNNRFIRKCDDYRNNCCEHCASDVEVVPHDELMENTVNAWWKQCDSKNREVVSGLNESDFSTEQEYENTCDAIWNAKTDEEKITIWNQIVNRENNE